MINSIFATNLKIAMRNKDKYHTDNGKRMRTKKYTAQDLANDLGYSINTVNGWTKANGGMPSCETVSEIAKVLNVDVAYLLGAQKCQHAADQSICDITELNETSAKVLSGLNGIAAEIMNELLNHRDFVRSILLVWDYTHSHNKEVTITNTLDDSKDPPLVDDAQREVMKYRATDAFGKILDDIYNAHKQEAIDVKVYSMLVKMKNEVEQYIELKDVAKARQLLLKHISIRQGDIKKISPDEPICKLTPEQILDNFDQITAKL